MTDMNPDDTLSAYGILYGSSVGMYIEPPLAFDGPVRGPRTANSDSIPARLSPGEACLPSPNPGKIIHIIESYGDEPMQVSEFDLDDLEDERT